MSRRPFKEFLVESSPVVLHNQSYSAVAVQPKRDRLDEVVDLGGKQCRTFVIKTLTNFANNDLVGTPNLPNPVNVEVWGPQFGGVSLGQS